MKTTLPLWAEEDLRVWGPQPAFGEHKADPAALARYAQVTERFRRRWSELDDDVWPLFGDGGKIEHILPARRLFMAMIDMARYGSRAELSRKRKALVEVECLEDEVRKLADQMQRKLLMRAQLVREQTIDGGLDDDAVDAVDTALAALLLLDWREPRLWSSLYDEATSSRKSDRDALAFMLHALEDMAPTLAPVTLTDRARATIFNVAHDADDHRHYGAEAVKKARSDLRRLR